MSNQWDMSRLLRLAGIQQPEQTKLNEGYDFDDDEYSGDEDPDVRIADEDKRQTKFEKKNKGSIKSAEKEADKLKSKPAAKKDEKKPDAEKKQDDKKVEPAPAKKAEEKKAAADKPKAEAKKDEKKDDGHTFVHGKGFVKKGEESAAKKVEDKKSDDKKVDAKKPEKEAQPKKEDPDKAAKKDVEKADDKKSEATATSDAKKAAKAREWLKSNPNHTRGDFRKAMSAHGISDNYANTFYYAQKAREKAAMHGPEKLKEVYFIVHPFMESFVLAENREMSTMQWIDSSSDLPPYVFETEEEAKKIAKYMAEWKGQTSVIKKFEFDDEE